MAGLKAIKTKIRSIEKTEKVTKAMEAVSAAKMRKAQQVAISSRAYARAATSILARLSGTKQFSNHPLVRGTAREEKVLPANGRQEFEGSTFSSRAIYIVITSDKGLAGALNSAVLRATQDNIRSAGLSVSEVSIIAIGRKANDFFTARGIEVVQYYSNNDEIDGAAMQQILTAARVRFESGAADTVKIAYQNFISTFEQRPTLRTIFPLSIEELQKVVNDIQIKRPDAANVSSDSSHRLSAETFAAQASYTVEPNEEEVLSAVVPMLAGIFLYHALLESQASEHSARMVSMKSASDKAAELTDIFTLKYNKARQAAITQEISEITGGLTSLSL